MLKAEYPPSITLNLDNLTIYGKSNINNFSFYFDNNPESDFQENVITKRDKQKTEFLLPVDRFKTINKGIQNDFFKLIEADKFHYISFAIDNDQMELFTSESEGDSINATITIAQESKQICILIKKDNKQIKNQFFTGEIKFLLTDFKLTPVSKFLGLVKVDNNLVIDFRINFVPSFI
jgi:hypothetical protein